jgi:oxalate/formate antiporter
MMDVSLKKTRLLQLICGTCAITFTSGPQYTWTLFVPQLREISGLSLPLISWAFTLLVVLEAGSAPAQGWLLDRLKPAWLMGFGSVLILVGMVGSSFATNLLEICLTYGLLCGLGTGSIAAGTYGIIPQWFPDKRGTTLGITAAGYAFGAALLPFPVDYIIRNYSNSWALVFCGAVIGILSLVFCFGVRAPTDAERAALPRKVTVVPGKNIPPSVMLKTPVFWLIYAMMAMMTTGGLMLGSQFVPFTKESGITNAVVWGLLAVPLALTVDRVANAISRPFFGTISDKLGRENTMALAFVIEAISLTILVLYRLDPVMVVIFSGLAFFGYGEVFTTFPATLMDTFGTDQNNVSRFGWLYTSKGIGAVFGAPLAAYLHDAVNDWAVVFYVVVCLDLFTACLALFVLKPARRKFMSS